MRWSPHSEPRTDWQDGHPRHSLGPVGHSGLLPQATGRPQLPTGTGMGLPPGGSLGSSPSKLSHDAPIIWALLLGTPAPRSCRAAGCSFPHPALHGACVGQQWPFPMTGRGQVGPGTDKEAAVAGEFGKCMRLLRAPGRRWQGDQEKRRPDAGSWVGRDGWGSRLSVERGPGPTGDAGSSCPCPSACPAPSSME